jgi:pyruvate formate lyase activating enzyme
MTQGLITDIQRFSLNDGPGIRTTVFSKGCNMKCAWCHNPETISGRPQLQFFEGKCIGCGGCRLDEDTLYADPDKVITDSAGNRRYYLGNCQARALVKVGRLVTPEDILRESLPDKRFYENSHGGVTLSGGEITTQMTFALETLSLLRDNGIHTAIETNLAISWDEFEKLLPVLDLLIFDLKIIDFELHREWTGIGNERILENARRISAQKVPLIIRTPVIPGFNDNAQAIDAIAGFIRDYPNLSYYELLSFNPLGADKYRCLGIPYRMQNAPLIPTDTMHCLQHAAAAHGIEVRIA